MNSIAKGDKNFIILAGFKATKSKGTIKVKPSQPTVIISKNAGSAAIAAECGKVANVDFYGCLISTSELVQQELNIQIAGQLVIRDDSSMMKAVALSPMPPVVAVFDMNKSRKKNFSGLQPGTHYYFYFYAGNSAGLSLMSIGSSIICG